MLAILTGHFKLTQPNTFLEAVYMKPRHIMIMVGGTQSDPWSTLVQIVIASTVLVRELRQW